MLILFSTFGLLAAILMLMFSAMIHKLKAQAGLKPRVKDYAHRCVIGTILLIASIAAGWHGFSDLFEKQQSRTIVQARLADNPEAFLADLYFSCCKGAWASDPQACNGYVQDIALQAGLSEEYQIFRQALKTPGARAHAN